MTTIYTLDIQFEGYGIFVSRIQTVHSYVHFICPDDSRETEFETIESITNLQKHKIELKTTSPCLCFIAGSIVFGRIHVAVLSESSV
jgi:hypothetical protein